MTAAVGTCVLVLGLLGFATIKRLAQRELPVERARQRSQMSRAWIASYGQTDARREREIRVG